MALPVAGYLGAVYFSSTTNPPTALVGKVQSVDGLDFERDEIDVTAIGQTSVGGESSILGKYKGMDFTIKVYRDLTDAAQLDLHNTFLTGSGQGYFIVRDTTGAATATNGWGFRGLVKGVSYEGISKGSDAIQMTIKCKILGAPVVANGTIPAIPT